MTTSVKLMAIFCAFLWVLGAAFYSAAPNTGPAATALEVVAILMFAAAFVDTVILVGILVTVYVWN